MRRLFLLLAIATWPASAGATSADAGGTPFACTVMAWSQVTVLLSCQDGRYVGELRLTPGIAWTGRLTAGPIALGVSLEPADAVLSDGQELACLRTGDLIRCTA